MSLGDELTLDVVLGGVTSQPVVAGHEHVGDPDGEAESDRESQVDEFAPARRRIDHRPAPSSR